MIRKVVLNDAQAITNIYNYYVTHSIATFDENAVETAVMKAKIETVTQKYPWIVFEENQEVIGYAYASTWKPRSAYNKTVEVSVYLKHDVVSKGIGTKLYAHLIDLLKAKNMRVLIGGVTLPNPTSVALHEKFGFEKVAHFKDVGFKFNKWLDVGYWQLTIK